MKTSGLSVAAIGFAILVIAIDFAVVRTAFLSSLLRASAEPGARLLPGMLAYPIFGPGPKGWAVFAFFLLPMIDTLLIGVYRLRGRRDDAGTVGYVIAGSLATLAVFTSCLISPATAIGLCMPISRRIALASFHGLERLFGNAASSRFPMEWTYVVIFAVLVPIAFFCILPLLAALIGGWVGRHYRPSQPTVGAGFGETTRGRSGDPEMSGTGRRQDCLMAIRDTLLLLSPRAAGVTQYSVQAFMDGVHRPGSADASRAATRRRLGCRADLRPAKPPISGFSHRDGRVQLGRGSSDAVPGSQRVRL